MPDTAGHREIFNRLKGTGAHSPPRPPYGVARGAPEAPLRSADSLAAARSFNVSEGGRKPRDNP
jgi:hypothetical protein